MPGDPMEKVCQYFSICASSIPEFRSALQFIALAAGFLKACLLTKDNLVPWSWVEKNYSNVSKSLFVLETLHVFCTLRGRTTISIISLNGYLSMSTYWKAASAKYMVFRMVCLAHLAGNDWKFKLERCLTNFLKTKENLRIQLRLGVADFPVFRKYIKTGGRLLHL